MPDATIDFKSITSGGFVFHDIPTIKLGSTGREQLEEVLKQDKELEEKVKRRKELDNAMKRVEKWLWEINSTPEKQQGRNIKRIRKKGSATSKYFV